MIEKLVQTLEQVRNEAPLIHCITNHITIDKCADILLAAGGRPIMAEHPKEVCAITKTSRALAVNLGNITDTRMEAMRISGEAARQEGIPSVIDLVGVAVSPLRLTFAKQYIAQSSPWVIKGNVSEVRALCGMSTEAKGIDAGAQDRLEEERLRLLSKQTKAVIVVTGAVDLVCNEEVIYRIQNGTPKLSRVTGTGCMVNILTGLYLSQADPLVGALLGVCTMGIAGELADEKTSGIGSFYTALLDEIDGLGGNTLRTCIRWEKTKWKN